MVLSFLTKLAIDSVKYQRIGSDIYSKMSAVLRFFKLARWRKDWI